MKNAVQVGFWEKLARIILKNRITILVDVISFNNFPWLPMEKPCYDLYRSQFAS